MADQEHGRKPKKKSKKKSKDEDEGKKRRASSEEIVKAVNGQVDDNDEGQHDAKQVDSADHEKTPAGVWTAEHDLALLQKVEEFLDQSERYVKVRAKTIYVKDIDWGKVTLVGFDAETVQSQWSSITSKIRKMRSAREILQEAKEVITERGRNNESKAKAGAKRKREKADPAFPKRPKTAFFLFKDKKHAHMIEKYPNLKGNELTAKLGKKWQKLSDEKKKYYRDLYNEEKVRFEQEVMDYLLEHFPGEVRPKTAFDLWAERKAVEAKQNHPDISDRKLTKKLNKKWEKLDSNEKELWEKLAKKQHDSFRRKMMQRMRLNSN